MIKRCLSICLLLVAISGFAQNKVLIVADEFPAMSVLAKALETQENIPSKVVSQTEMPADLAEYSVVIVYIHGRLAERAELAFIEYTQSGGKLIVLHHSISSGKRNNKHWFKFLGISLLEADVSQGGYKWIEDVELDVVNLAPDHYVTTHKVRYDGPVLYTRSDDPGAQRQCKYFEMTDTEVYLNHTFTEPRTVLMGFKYTDANSGITYMQDRAGWLKKAGKGWIYYFMPGHTERDFEHAAYARILVNAVTCESPIEPKPNIVFILADDLGYGDLGCFGQTKIKTPCLDRLAAEGMRFTRHYSGSPVCAPSRCVLLTGKHTGHSYIRANDEFPKGVDVWKDRTIEGQRPLPPGTVTLANLLKNAGYTTGAIGKWGLGAADSEGAPWLHGFDFFYGYLCQRQAHNHYPTHLWRNNQKHVLDGNTLGNIKGKHYAHDLMVQEALKFIRDNKNKPFFLYIPFHIPHVALQAPDDSLAQYKDAFPETPYTGDKGYLPHPTPRAAYAAMISRMDSDIGRIMQLLKDLGLDEKTLVLFSSDNGPTYAGGADPEFFQSAGPLGGLKGSLFEGGIRVPMIARWPGKIDAGSVTEHLSAFWDVMPTLTEIAGAETPADTDGISFAPTLLGKGAQKQHEFLYWEYPAGAGSQAVNLGRWKGLRLNAHKNPNGHVALYDLATDVGETHDVSSQRPAIARRIEQIMANSRTPSEIDKWNFGKN